MPVNGILVMQHTVTSLNPHFLYHLELAYTIMPPKRKREEEKDADSVFRPAAGTRTYETGQAVKEGLASGSRQGK